MMLKCRNIKINLAREEPVDFGLLHCQQFEFVEKKTCFTLRPLYLDCVITIYKHGPKNLHITGIRSSSMVKEVFFFVENILGTKALTFEINNSMFCGKLDHHIDISDVVGKVEQNFSCYACSYVEEIFPALFIKPIQKKSGTPTTILFPNGSYIIMGGTNMQKVRNAYMFVMSITK